MDKTIDYTKLTRDELRKFTDSLSTREPEKFTDNDLRRIALYINSDGCSKVADFYLCSCIEHDFYYATHRDFNGNSITRAQAEKLFKRAIQRNSIFSWLSPMSYWRYLGVRVFGSLAWKDIK